MPGFRLNRRRRRRRVPKRFYKKKLKLNLGKTLDSKINTALERRMVAISKQQDEKMLEKRILRQFVRGTYDNATRVYNGISLIGGLIDEVGQVRKADGIGAIDVQGKRLGNRILITGFQLMFKYQLPENATPATWENCNVYYALACVTDDFEPLSGTGYTPQTVTMGDILPFYPFGYSPKLDQHESAQFKKRVVRKLIKGSVSIRSTEVHAQSGNIKRFVKLKRPIRVDYATSDSSTQQKPLNKKFYLAFRTNAPTTSPADMQPFVTTCLKTYYHEPL